jgi:AmpD protein
LVTEACFVASPNCDARPAAAKVDVVVIHCISLPPNQFGGDDIEAFFCNCLDVSRHPYFREIQDLKVSTHFLIRRDGGLMQFVATHMRAWHAGTSELHGRYDVNDFSIGVELEGTDDQPFEEVQYETLIELTRVLIAVYPGIVAENLVGHCDIAPARKTDPGPHFDWNRYHSEFRAGWRMGP